jgi:SAM-dependent methyltransferase
MPSGDCVLSGIMTATTASNVEELTQERDAFVENVLEATAGGFRMFTMYLGIRLGFYEALARGPLTAKALAETVSADARYAREWLEQQSVAGILRVENPEASSHARRFSLPPGHAEVLTDADSLNHLAPLVRLFVGAVSPLDRVVDAYRTGEGVPFSAYGADLREGQAGMNRTMFLQLLGREWLPVMKDVDARLREDPPARVADVGCGAGWSAIGIAQAYPRVHVDGFDLDAPSVDLARANAADAGLGDRVRFHERDAGDADLAGAYDLVTAFECIHDLSQPVAVLRSMRRLAGSTGAVLVVDERVGDAFTPNGEDLEWMMYGWSVLHCLPVGRSESPSAETGAVIRAGTLRAYAEEAGFRDVEVLPIENPFFRFYRLEA